MAELLDEDFAAFAAHERDGDRIRRHDIVTGGIVAAAVLLFVGTGSTAAIHIVRSFSGLTDGPDRMMSIAVLLNIALILLGWRRYRDLRRDYEDRVAAERKAWRLASTDPLTGFGNRRAVLHHGSAMIAEARQRGTGIVAFMLDLDQFKTVNDVYGHAAGDEVLRIAAERIVSIMPVSALKARLGGDEFICVFSADPDQDALVEALARDLVATMIQPIVIDTGHATVSVSLGIARLGQNASDIAALMRRADIAMYGAKGRGRNGFCWFAPDIEEKLQARGTLERDLRDGISAGQFVPYFEPQVELATGRLSGFELRVHWHSPTRGTVPIEDVAMVAEQCGLGGELSLTVMRDALVEAGTWDPALTLTVALTNAQLKDPWLAQKIVKLLIETGFPSSRLDITVPEAALLANPALARATVDSLRNQGIRIGIDDFGSGSGLARLDGPAFDRIGIGDRFVTSMTSAPKSAAMVGAIARLGENLGLPITAKGIEDDDTVQRLVALGCAKGQGRHLGQPSDTAMTRNRLATAGSTTGGSSGLSDAAGDGTIAPSPPSPNRQPPAHPDAA